MKKNYKKTLLISAITVASSLATLAQQTTVVKKDWLAENGAVDTIPYTATTLDILQNVVITGNTIVAGQNTNILTSKIAPNGTILWQQQINGAANGKDFGTANCIDASGNIYIAGAIFDNTNNYDYLIACYDPSGTIQWQQTFDGTGHNYDVPTAITTDNNGNVYVTGASLSATTLTDYVTLQLNASNGQINWVKTYNFANLYEVPVSIAVNTNGNIYVTGASASALNNWDIATAEYDPSGTLINVNRNVSTANGFDKPAEMKRDANGNIYIVGRAVGTNNSLDIKLIKLNSSLALQWIKTFDAAGLNDEANSLDIDNQGNIIIAGYVRNPTTGTDFIVIKYDTNGNLLWQKQQSYSGGDDHASKVIVDASGNIYVSGVKIIANERSIETVSLDPSGNKRWEKEFAESGKDEVRNMRVDSQGNIYISASRNDNNATIRYSQTQALIPPDFNNEQPSATNLFYENRGQIITTNATAATNVKYYTDGAFPQQYIQNNILSYAFSNKDTTGNDTIQRIDLNFLNSDNNAKPYPYEEQAVGYLNYFKPNAPNGIVNIKGNNKIIVPNIYSKIDLIYSSNNASTKMYLVAKVGGSFAEVKIQLNGATQTNVVGDKLMVSSNWNTFSVGKLIAYQLQNNVVIPITNWTPTFNAQGNNTYSFNIGAYDATLPLVIEITNDAQATMASIPLENIDWSTYYSGPLWGGPNDNHTRFTSTCIDSQHNLFVLGRTNQNDFPTQNITAVYNISQGHDAVLVKFNSLGVRQWATYYGGNDFDEAYNVTTNANNEPIFTGFTFSSTFPVSNGVGYQNLTTASPTNSDIYIVHLSSNGLTKLWAATFGGTTASEYGTQVAVDNLQNIYLVGTGDNNTPHMTSGNYNKVQSGLLAKFKPTGDLLWATGFGTDGETRVQSIVFDANNDFYIAGVTSATDFPLVNSQAYSTYSAGGQQFVTKFVAENTVDWSTFLSQNTGYSSPQNLIIANNHLYIHGEVNNNTLFTVDPGAQAFFSTNSALSCTSVFLAKLSLTGNVTWCTYFGGNVSDYARGITADQFGNVYLTGYTSSPTFVPLQQSGGYYQRNTFFYPGQGSSVEISSYIEAFGADNKKKWGTYFGGSVSDAILYNVCDPTTNKLYIVGNSDSHNYFPLNDGGGIPYYQGILPTYIAGGFVTRFDISNNFSSIETLSNNNKTLTIYPNPTNSLLYINSSEINSINNELIITNQLGLEVFRIKNVNVSQSINLPKLSSGFYNVIINSNDNVFTSKLVISK